MPTFFGGPEPLTMFASAAVRTEKIQMGSSIVPTYPRHPVVTAHQVEVIAQLAPGRFRLGVGPSHGPLIRDIYGLDFRAPLAGLSEYMHILKVLLKEGAVDFDGRHYSAHARMAAPVDVPVMASALRPKSFELCGAESDGAISWDCPGAYLRDVALPAMKAGADRADRPVPPLLAHAPVCVHDDPEEGRAAMGEHLFSPLLPFYRRMFAAAGFPEASNGEWSDAMIDAVALWGNESQVGEKLLWLFEIGATEVVAAPVPAGKDPEASMKRTLRMLSQVSPHVSP